MTFVHSEEPRYFDFMSKNSERDALRKELTRLLAGLDFYRDWRLSKLKRQRQGVSEEEISNEVVMPGSVFLQLFEGTTGRQSAKVVDQVRIWYAHASSDLNSFEQLSDEDRNEIRQFLRDFQEALGFSFHSTAGTLRKLAERVLNRGSIATEMEFYHLTELRNDLSQSILNTDEMIRISNLLCSFEDKAATC